MIKVKSDCNWTRTQNHLVRKRTLNHLASVSLRTKCFWVRVQLQSQNLIFATTVGRCFSSDDCLDDSTHLCGILGVNLCDGHIALRLNIIAYGQPQENCPTEVCRGKFLSFGRPIAFSLEKKLEGWQNFVFVIN